MNSPINPGLVVVPPPVSPVAGPEPRSSRAASPSLGRRVLGHRPGGDEYRVRLAQSRRDVQAAQELRFMVFNLELNEGLAASFHTLRDEDPFDAVCDHLLVEESVSGAVVGTYRLQTGPMARAHRGFYGAQEFDFSPFATRVGEMVELGRACVHRSHRNLRVLSLLWQAIFDYARERGARYLIGCSSLPTTDPALGWAAYDELSRRHLVEPALRTNPLPAYDCGPRPPAAAGGGMVLPKLLRAYLSLGAVICGPPALDRDFGTVDFLTWMDIGPKPAGAEAE